MRGQEREILFLRCVCRCGFDDPRHPSEPTHEPDDPASFSVTFSRSAVIYEDEYEDSPDVTVPKRSARVIHWGISNVVHTLKIRVGSAEYPPQISVVCPQSVEGCNARAYTNGLPPGVAGGLQLRQGYRIHPLTVSFKGLSIEEVPCDDAIPPEGYFMYTSASTFFRSHTRSAGAGEWGEVTEGNWMGGERSFDKAGYLGALTRRMPDGTATTNTAFGWLGGSLTWKVPFGWSKGQAHGSTADPVDRFAEDTVQIFRVEANGDFSVEKLKHKAERKITGEVNVYNLDDLQE